MAPPGTVVQVGTAREYRITRSDGSRVTLTEPGVVGDSIIGKLSPVPAWPDTSTTITIALTDIRAMAAREPDITASVLVGTAATFVGFIALLRASGLPTGD